MPCRTIREIAAIAAGWREEVRQFRAKDLALEREFKARQRETRAAAADLERKAKHLEGEIKRLRRKGLTDDVAVPMPDPPKAAH